MIVRQARGFPCFGRDVLKNQAAALTGFRSVGRSAGQERANGDRVNACGTNPVILGRYFLLKDCLVNGFTGGV